MDAGQYLPDWHPQEDYRRLYASNSAMGGGVVLDGIHEMDYARWLFGDVSQVYCQGGKLSSLEIDTEDSVNIIMTMAVGFSVSLHMDYVQRAYCRSCKVVGETGTILWNIADGRVNLYSAQQGAWQCFPEPEGYDINQMYVDEMRHFLSCLNGEEDSKSPVSDARRVLEIALAIKSSMLSGQALKLLP